MLDVTAAAAEKLQALRAADPALGVLRVYVAGRACCGIRYGLAFDEHADEDDAIAECSGIPVAVDQASLPYVQGAQIDFVAADEGEGFMVTNAAYSGGGCACGGR
ncbi:MAG TPA: iron-sulfur cluster assembly accessory protein [Candidatus Limnocylindria bacterium]|nr:iron-sulfur cluster assembly accessory protein [Candidatus Limnocylindria bacterium]